APEDGSRTAERFDAPDHRRLDDLDHGLPVGHRKRNPIEQDLDAAHTERCPGPHPTNRNSLAQREMTPVVHPDARRHAENGLERKRRLERDLFRVANLDAQCIRCGEGGLGFPDGIDRNLGERELEGVALLCRCLKNVRPEESEDEKSDRPMSTPQGPPMTGRLADDYIPHIPIYVIRDRIHLTSCASASCETPTKSMTPDLYIPEAFRRLTPAIASYANSHQPPYLRQSSPQNLIVQTMKRREFLERSAKAAAALSAAPWIRSTTGSPNEALSVALIGARSMGFGDLVNHLRQTDVVCGGLCDVDDEVLERRAKDVEEMTGVRPPLYRDYRELLDAPDVDAVIIGTPDHWHALQLVHACEAGKDVYVEKPMANSIAELDAMVGAPRAPSRVVRVGQQQRSGPDWREFVDFVRSAAPGGVRQVGVWGFLDSGTGAPRAPDEAPPEHVDFDVCVGPAPEQPFNP